MKAPFQWFGGKRRVAPEVWAAFGDVANYVILCSECCTKSSGAFSFTSEVSRDPLPGHLRTPRRTFFEYIVQKQEQEWTKVAREEERMLAREEARRSVA